MKKLIAFVIIVGALGTGGWAYYQNRARPEPTVSTVPVSRGDVVERVQATGTLEAVTTVDVGTQVSGVVQDLYADFNDIVKKGQVIARLDPSILQVQIESQQANVIRAEADLERLRVTLEDAKQKLDRAQAMFKKELVPKTDLEAAEIAVKSAEAQIKSSEASLTQTRASLNQARVNLNYTVITSPIDGIVISRNVDPGQTVASSMNAPTLFVIAADLTKMQVVANIDESDVGKMRPGQTVSFRVDAYPTDNFLGSVQQVRLQPAVVQNVVVYSTVIAVPESAAEVEARHDGDGRHRDRAPEQRAARADRGRPLPADRSHVHGPQPARATGSPARPRRLRWTGRGRDGAGRGREGAGGQGGPGAGAPRHQQQHRSPHHRAARLRPHPRRRRRRRSPRLAAVVLPSAEAQRRR